MANFNNLLEQIKSQRLKSVIGTLQAAKSKSIDKWKEIVSLKKIIFNIYKMDTEKLLDNTNDRNIDNIRYQIFLKNWMMLF